MPFHTVSVGVDDEAYERAFIKAFQLAEAEGVDVIYLVPALANLDADSAVKLLGKARIAAFKKAGRLDVNGVKYILETKMKKRQTLGPAVLLSIHLSSGDMLKAMADHRVRESVYVLWSEAELAAYLAKHPDSVAV